MVDLPSVGYRSKGSGGPPERGGKARRLGSSARGVARIDGFSHAGENFGRISKLGGVDQVAEPRAARDAVGIEQRAFDRQQLPVELREGRPVGLTECGVPAQVEATGRVAHF